MSDDPRSLGAQKVAWLERKNEELRESYSKDVDALRLSRDIQKALAQRYWDDLQTARAEIAALTKERDAMKAALRRIAEDALAALDVESAAQGAE